MKSCIYAIMLLCLTSVTQAQTGTFRKILNDRKSVDREVFYDQLLQFQKENVEFSNVYYQLGKVEEEIFSKTPGSKGRSLDTVAKSKVSREELTTQAFTTPLSAI